MSERSLHQVSKLRSEVSRQPVVCVCMCGCVCVYLCVWMHVFHSEWALHGHAVCENGRRWNSDYVPGFECLNLNVYNVRIQSYYL